ncbi:hypothetical protein ACFQ1S_22730 [Kibdelosporangium lantanae]|uniref:Uncharacterized protein n=1 Tax=Kibdelosporangium lantanae TaxID=1497396 RepID=A0ABW3MEM8_9PSEU
MCTARHMTFRLFGPVLLCLALEMGAFYGFDPLGFQIDAGAVPLVLLAWADTLTDISAEVWRVPDGGSVHLSVRGQLAGGIVVRVFDGVDHGAHLDLEPNQQRPVSLACLREWATLDQGVAA